MTPRVRGVVLLALAAAAGACGGGGRDAAVGQGFEIVQALEAYRARHGAYPDSLPQLVPDPLPRLETPAFGAGRWEYRREPPAFLLRVPAAGDSPGVRFDYATQRWLDE